MKEGCQIAFTSTALAICALQRGRTGLVLTIYCSLHLFFLNFSANYSSTMSNFAEVNQAKRFHVYIGFVFLLI